LTARRFAADSSKLGREAFYKVFDVADFTAGITDDLLDPIRASLIPVRIIQVSAHAKR
jgi:DeoR/GlpR family transcriptional regulator of sugar metabolism